MAHCPCVERKVCTKCGRRRNVKFFVRQRAAADGLNPWCQDCRHENRVARYQRHRQEELADTMARRDPTTHRKYMRRYYATHVAVSKEYAKDYYRRHKDEPRFVRANRRRVAIWRAENPTRHRANCDVQRARRKQAPVVDKVDRRIVYDRDGGICYLCNKPVAFAKMHMDHVTPLSKGGEHSYRNVRVAHAKCNLRKSNKILA